MPAHSGNQYALGNDGGRPCEFDKQKEFNALFEWAKTDAALVIKAFPPYRGYTLRTMERWAEENEEFCRLYNMSKELIGARREEILILNNSASPFQRCATYYDESLKLHERAEKQFEASLKQPEQKENATTPEQLNTVNQALDV